MVVGIIPLILPEVVCATVPIMTGDEKLLLASESWAVKTLPELYVPVTVKGMETEAPVQKGEPVIEPFIVIVLEQALLIVVPVTVKLPAETVGNGPQF